LELFDRVDDVLWLQLVKGRLLGFFAVLDAVFSVL